MEKDEVLRGKGIDPDELRLEEAIVSFVETREILLYFVNHGCSNVAGCGVTPFRPDRPRCVYRTYCTVRRSLHSAGGASAGCLVWRRSAIGVSHLRKKKKLFLSHHGGILTVRQLKEVR